MNQRTIKFRAWDRDEKRVLNPETYHLELYNTGEVFLKNVSRTTSEIDLMQFTGLHDKNGKEIYESDLLSNDAGAPVMEVVWNQGSWTLNGLENLISEKIDHTKFLTVIGNKYEGEGR